MLLTAELPDSVAQSARLALLDSAVRFQRVAQLVKVEMLPTAELLGSVARFLKAVPKHSAVRFQRVALPGWVGFQHSAELLGSVAPPVRVDLVFLRGSAAPQDWVVLLVMADLALRPGSAELEGLAAPRGSAVVANLAVVLATVG